ncbi:unnamed protein product [Urochloa decumbens]|uniref:KIB1-4 beta-propeller domain-containing protein n=1 Tax=Urochloa decumbens TaxID=240449 RepID=A0ABC9CBC0_9POAL
MVEDGINEGTFGLHDVSKGKSYCIHKKCLVNRFWIGGKDDWIVISDNRCSMNLINLLDGDSVPLPLLSTIDGVEINQHYDLEIVTKSCVRRLRRVVLCRTPLSSLGHAAIALFDDGLIAYTSKSEKAWKLLVHPTEWSGCLMYFPEVYLDALVHKRRIVAVDEEGDIFSWDIYHHRKYPLRIMKPDIPAIEGCNEEVFYFAKSPLDELILISMHGKGATSYMPSYRVVESEHNRFDHISAMIMHKFDDSDGTWQRICRVGLGQSLFLGLNYPFFGSWSGLKPNSVYVANVAHNDVMIIGMGSEADVGIKMQDYPIKDGFRLLDGHSMRTPMWFRPKRPSARRIEDLSSVFTFGAA